ncbi:metallophosphoesterase family protein [Bacillus thuringiensis]|uniref:metallophosphoesterase family protein n=1 Tax=Bacillus thuringiensis TaxID=1428 RepID=UPI000BFA91B0|nr:metallophosphoesterase [Bacillus thuringiensis]PET17059.1 hypothetical protein CN517_21250 [Bacillus thuringiensis]
MDNIVNVLHISDIHFGMEKAEQVTMAAQRKNSLDQLLKILSDLELEDKPDIIVISGDISWQGKKEGYLAAKSWIEEELLVTTNLTSKELIVCAGNHDINRNKAFGTLPPTNSRMADDWLKIESLENFIRPFEAFNDFCKDLGIPELSIGSNKFNLIGQRNIHGIKFIVLNSAWFCRNKEDSGKLWIGLPQLELMQAHNQIIQPEEYGEGIMSIGILHHPQSWLHVEEQNTYEERPSTYRYLSERTHLILSGHVHAAIEYPTKSFNRAHVVIGGATYADKRYRNNFSILKINKDKRECVQIPFEYDPRYSKWDRKNEKKIFLTVEEERRGELEKTRNVEQITPSKEQIKLSINKWRAYKQELNSNTSTFYEMQKLLRNVLYQSSSSFEAIEVAARHVKRVAWTIFNESEAEIIIPLNLKLGAISFETQLDMSLLNIQTSIAEWKRQYEVRDKYGETHITKIFDETKMHINSLILAVIWKMEDFEELDDKMKI